MKSAFWTVLGIHFVALVGILTMSTSSSAQAKQIEEDKKYVLSDAPLVGVEPANISQPTPNAKPTPETTCHESQPKVVSTPTKTTSSPHLAKEYVVKKGDTFTSIVKRYGLNPSRLIKLNGIKNENKLLIGQKLKFIE
jgi:LysM repeat protein